MKRSSSIPKKFGSSRKPKDQPPKLNTAPTGISLNPDSSVPDAQSELEKLAETSQGASAYHGYRGLIPHKYNIQNFTVLDGLEHKEPRDQETATVRQFQEGRDQEKRQAKLDKASGDSMKKLKKSDGPTRANGALYGK
jgi:hypothetical protein